MPNIEYLQKQLELTENCPHECTGIRYRTATNGVKMYKSQCVRCGELVGNWIPHSAVPEGLTFPPIDDELRSTYKETASELRKEILKIKSEEERRGFFEGYNEYLRSEKWIKKRNAVLKRCHQVCEGCGKEEATQVHHLTYAHVYDEFLFELVGVCNDCHVKLHLGKDDGE